MWIIWPTLMAFHNKLCTTSTKITHWGRVTHICVSKLIIIGSDNGLSPERHQAIIWTIAGILLIGTLGTNFSQILSEIHTFSFKKMHLKMSSAKWRQFRLGLNVIRDHLMAAIVGWLYLEIYTSEFSSEYNHFWLYGLCLKWGGTCLFVLSYLFSLFYLVFDMSVL